MGGVMTRKQKPCPNCRKTVPGEALFCMHCGYEFPAPPPKKKDSGCVTWLVASVGLLMVIGYIGSLSSSDTATTQDDAPHPTWTATPETRQPADPSATNTPIPASLPTSPTSLDLQTYATQMLPLLESLVGASADLSELFTNPRLGDNEWTVRVAGRLTVIRYVYQEASAIVPPEALKNAHQTALTGLSLCNDGATLVIAGLDNLDGDALAQAMDAFIRCGSTIDTATDMMQAAVSGDEITGARTNNDANLRAGPGTEFAVIGSAPAGQSLEIAGRNEAGDWYRLADGAWIAGFLVTGAPALETLPVIPVALDAASPTAETVPIQDTPTSSSAWIRKERGYTFTSDCPCQSDTRNCDDFKGAAISGQACYLKCMEETGRDVHRLDGDSDGSACEWSW